MRISFWPKTSTGNLTKHVRFTKLTNDDQKNDFEQPKLQFPKKNVKFSTNEKQKWKIVTPNFVLWIFSLSQLVCFTFDSLNECTTDIQKYVVLFFFIVNGVGFEQVSQEFVSFDAEHGKFSVRDSGLLFDRKTVRRHCSPMVLNERKWLGPRVDKSLVTEMSFVPQWIIGITNCRFWLWQLIFCGQKW